MSRRGFDQVGEDDGDVRPKLGELVREGLAAAAGFFAAHADVFVFHAPAGGSVCFPAFRGRELRARHVAAYCDALVKEHGLLLLPASVFDGAGDEGDLEASELGPHFRLGLGRRDCAANLRRLGDVLARDARFARCA